MTGGLDPADGLTTMTAELVQEVAATASSAGLDSGPVEFQVVPGRVLESISAYGGLLTRLAHWSFGKAYYRLHLAQQYRAARLYELVVPSRPAVAYVLDTTGPAELRLIIAHVLAHADFFRHHVRFTQQPGDMPRRMRVWREWMEERKPLAGARGWEDFLDDAAVLADLIDPYSTDARSPQNVMGFVIQEARDIGETERHALGIVEQQARYVRPSLETKIANEGWATWWHRELLRRLPLVPSDPPAPSGLAMVLDALRLHAQVVAPSRALNPYALGLALWERAAEDSARMWRERTWINDALLVDRYLTPDIAAAALAFAEGSFDTVKHQLVLALDNGGIPRIEVGDADGGALSLVHRYDGRELDWAMVPQALGAVSRLWRGPCQLFTTKGGEGTVWTSRAWTGDGAVSERPAASA